MDKEWLSVCATAGEFLYGKFPVNVLKAMYEKKKGCKADVSELIAMMQELESEGSVLLTYKEGQLNPPRDEGPGYFVPTDVRGTALEEVLRKADSDGNPYASMHFDMHEQESFLDETVHDVEFYIPSAEEIKELVEHGYIRSKAMTALENEIKRLKRDPGFLKKMWALISTDKMDAKDVLQEILSHAFSTVDAKDSRLTVPGENADNALDKLNRLLSYATDFGNNINLRNRRGWTPSALIKKQYPNGMPKPKVIRPGSAAAYETLKNSEKDILAMGMRPDYGTIGNFESIGPHGERRVVKVGPNDPCPCGSGLKYKKCHGRNR